MKKLVETILENLSTKDVFVFRVTCASCGTDYANKPVRFSKAGIVPMTPGKKIIYDAVYEQEFMTARQASIRNASEHLNYCPICKRIVCNQCFLICDDQDMCRQSAERLEERGRPVLSEAVVTPA